MGRPSILGLGPIPPASPGRSPWLLAMPSPGLPILLSTTPWTASVPSTAASLPASVHTPKVASLDPPNALPSADLSPTDLSYPQGCLPRSTQRFTVRRPDRFRIVLSTCFPSLYYPSDIFSCHVSFYLPCTICCERTRRLQHHMVLKKMAGMDGTRSMATNQSTKTD